MKSDLPLVRHGLLVVDAARTSAICWARVFSGPATSVITLTEVPANLGGGVINRVELFCRELACEMTLTNSRWFTCIPAGFCGMEEARWSEVTFGDPATLEIPTWNPTTLADVAAIVGGPWPGMPEHSALVQMVLDAGGQLEEPVPTTMFDIAPVETMPAPHEPFKCAHHDRFRAMRAQNSAADEVEIGQRFIASLTADDYLACRFHAADWKKIAAAAVTAIRTHGSNPTRRQLDAACAAAGLTSTESGWFSSLFGSESIQLGGGQYLNGQHRGCAIRASGAAEFVVGRNAPGLGEATTWTFLGES